MSHFTVSTFGEFSEVLTYDRGAMTIEVTAPHILCTGVLMIDQSYSSNDDYLLSRNLSIFSPQGAILEGVSTSIMRFSHMGHISIENILFRNGSANQDYSGGLTLTSIIYAKLTNVTFINCNPGPYISPFGGALSILTATVDMYDMTFLDNWAYFGGATWFTTSVNDIS
jgi:hypothetical protein